MKNGHRIVVLVAIFAISSVGLTGYIFMRGGGGEVGEREGASDVPGSSERKGPFVIDTPEIVRILEEEVVDFDSTTHAQRIGIRLKDGREYMGRYVYEEAGEYAKDKQLSDILNLVMYIKENRPAEEVDGWRIMCE